MYPSIWSCPPDYSRSAALGIWVAGAISPRAFTLLKLPALEQMVSEEMGRGASGHSPWDLFILASTKDSCGKITQPIDSRLAQLHHIVAVLNRIQILNISIRMHFTQNPTAAVAYYIIKCLHMFIFKHTHTKSFCNKRRLQNLCWNATACEVCTYGSIWNSK